MSELANRPVSARSVAFLLFDGVQTLDVCGPLDVFAQAEKLRPGSYHLNCVGLGGSIRTSAGLTVEAADARDVDLQRLDTIVVPGGGASAIGQAMQNQPLMHWVGEAAACAQRVAGVCTGAFLLAALGLLRGRRATTHWRGLHHLTASDPTIRVDHDAIFIEDGRIWTSAGVTSGIDLALALVRRDLGADTALGVCRDLVVPMARASGQSAFAEPMSQPDDAGADLDGLMAFVSANFARPISVPDMAEAVGLSPRTFRRRCQARFNMTPTELVQRARMEHARALLLNSKAPLKEIAAKLGYANEAALSHAFKRCFNISPSSFRKGFTAPGR